MKIFGEAYDKAFERELSEEVAMAPVLSNAVLGLINDDSNPVGRVHLGVVHLITLEIPEVKSREKALLDAGFVPLDELRSRYAELETWSQICLDNWNRIHD